MIFLPGNFHDFIRSQAIFFDWLLLLSLHVYEVHCYILRAVTAYIWNSKNQNYGGLNE